MKNLKDIITESNDNWSVKIQNPFNGATYERPEKINPKSDEYVCFVTNNKEMVWLSKSSLKSYCGYYDSKGDLQKKCESLNVGESYYYQHKSRDNYDLLFVRLK